MMWTTTTRVRVTLVVAAWSLGSAGGFDTAALAQEAGKIPIQRDLRRSDEIDRRLDRDRPVPTNPNVTPNNPSGVAGFSGPPGIIGDSVGNSGPLPPGGPGNDQ